MDGGDRRKQLGSINYASANISSQPATRQMTGGPAEHFRGGQVTAQHQATANAGMTTYATYGYPAAQYQPNPGAASGSIQGAAAGLQYPQVYAQESQQEPQSAQFPQYGSNVAYGSAQQQNIHTPYETLAQYQSRGTASIETLPSQYGVSQYIPSQGEPVTAGVTLQQAQYITSQPTSFHQPPSIDRSSLGQSFSSNVSDYNTAGSPQEIMDSREDIKEPLEREQYEQYQQSLAQVFRDIRAERMGDARDNLLKLSEWLVNNVEKTGLAAGTYISEEVKESRRQLWEEFNTCWLALVQKQRDMIDILLQSGQASPNMFSHDDMKHIGDRIVRFSDSLEGFGLVDYEMGLWEEEILSALGQCLDLIDDGDEDDPSATVMTRA